MNLAMQRFPKGMNPNAYLQQYAQGNNMDIGSAKGVLQSQFGDPMSQKIQSTSVFSLAGGAAQANPMGSDFLNRPEMMMQPDDDIKMAQMGQANGPNMLQSIMNFFKGGNGPQQEGDPQGFKELTFTGVGKNQEGPQKPGDPQGMQGMQRQQDPDAYAKQYAEENNITVEEAKQQLKAKYGNPQQMMG